MIQNFKKLDQFNTEFIKNEKLSYLEALCVYEQLHNEAVSLGIINDQNILEGIEVNLQISKIVNRLK
ncbi:MAG: hypothetical protein LHV68_09345 [Elusimicrobia bacterium]|nr:hypothetical protein [Candidatus Liberimonas magnetica]